MIDVVLYNTVGPAFTFKTIEAGGLGGSELEILQIAEGLTKRGYKVVIANGVTEETTERGVDFVPSRKIAALDGAHSLYIERMSGMPAMPLVARTVVRATDVYCPPYDAQRPIFSRGGLLVAVSNWQAFLFDSLVPPSQRRVINPILGPTPPTDKVAGRFVYASAPIKGLDATLAKWRRLHRDAKGRGTMKKARLVIVTPGHFDFYADRMPKLSAADKAIGVSYEGSPTPEAYRAWIASAEGLFYVNTMPETFGNVAAFAERSGTRTHILCKSGLGGLSEAIVHHELLTENEGQFDRDFMAAWQGEDRKPSDASLIPDRSVEALIPKWEMVLGLTRETAPSVSTEGPEQLKNAFKERLIALGDPAGSVTDYWRSRCAAQVEFAKTKPLANFLSWSDDVSMHEMPCFTPWYRALQTSAEWERWKRLSRRSLWGNAHKFSLDKGTSPVSLQHAYHLMRFEALTGQKLTDVAVIVEVGGGYGNFCRMLRMDGFRGSYVILDLPHQREFQRLFLALEQIDVTIEPKLIDGATLLLEADLPRLVEALEGKRIAFVSTWGLSETPLALRDKLSPILERAQRMLLTTQWPKHGPDNVDNAAYFDRLMKQGTWKVEVIKGHEGSRYLFGVATDGKTSPALQSCEQQFATEELPHNQQPVSGYFGGLDGFVDRLRKGIAPGGSEFALGLSLFSLAVSIRAVSIVEIGRFKGFATLALASALKFLEEEDWQECELAHQRPDVDYQKLEHPDRPRRVVSIDPFPTAEAAEIIESAGLQKYVEFVDKRSEAVTLDGQFVDLCFIDGDHSEAACRADFQRYSQHVRPGGYLVLHDYYGWWRGRVNGSPIKKVCDSIGPNFTQILIDTGYASFVIFKKIGSETSKVPAKVPPRSDGQPTIGLVILARNENPIVARAIASCDWVDCVTVIVGSESADGTAELCERMGAEVHVRPYVGSIAACRNEALSIAEQRTDWLLVLDADDAIRGDRPDLSAAENDCYMVTISDHGDTYPRVQLLRSRLGFTYEGCPKGCDWQIRHEYINGHGATIGFCTDFVYERLGHVSGVVGFQDQAGSRAKYLQHAKDLHHHHIDHPEDQRTVFYLGQSFRDAGEPLEAIRWYDKRVAMPGGFEEEAWWSQLQIGRLKTAAAEDPSAAYLKAFQMRPWRAEPLVDLAAYYRDPKRNMPHLAYSYALLAAQCPPVKGEQLFSSANLPFRILEELGINAVNSGHVDVALDALTRIQDITPAHLESWARDVLAVAQNNKRLHDEQAAK